MTTLRLNTSELNFFVNCFQACTVIVCSALFFAPQVAVAEEDAFVCMSGDEAECAFENESLSLFIRCQEAYNKGRETGDLTEARSLARQLLDRKNKYGKRMMRFIYVALSQGSHKNLVEAYRWLDEALANGEQYQRTDIERLRNTLAAKMTEQQLAEARKK